MSNACHVQPLEYNLIKRMKVNKVTVLIGPVSDDPAESVSGVNKALAAGLKEQFIFVASECNRRFGNTRQSRLNLWNVYYFLKHSLIWIRNLLFHRPEIAHYAVSSGIAMEKAIFLLAVARFCGARTVGHLHSGRFLEHWQGLAPSRQRIALKQFNKLDAFVVLSENWRIKVCNIVGIERSRIHVVNNPISPDFEDEALSISLDRLDTAILSLGTMGKDKGVVELITALAEVAKDSPNFILNLVGPERDPGIRALVEHRCDELSLRSKVHLKGSVHGFEKMDYFRTCSIFVLPSHYENFPLVVLEAAAAGHAIITTPVGALPEFFEDGVSCIFVEPRDPVQLASAIRKLVRDSSERLRLAEAARNMFQNSLSRTQIMHSMSQVYTKVQSVS